MKFSKLSTIQFEDNDFQSKSPLDLPIVPRGETITIMELAEGFNINHHPDPPMPASIELVDVRTQKRTTLSNTATAPCTFTGTIPATLRPGIYRAEFLVREYAPAVSAPFRVIAGNDWACIVGNSPLERYSDGTPSIVGGRRVKFYQYFRRKDFRLVPVESNTFYDDERGTSFSLQNKNFSRWHLEGYAGERTATAVSMLLAGSWSMLTYKEGGGNRVNYRLHKTGDLTVEAVGRGFCQFAGDFNAARQKQIAISLADAAEEGVAFDTSENLIVMYDDDPEQYRIPTAIFCLPYTNFEVEKKDGNRFLCDTKKSFKWIKFTSGKIPDNFGRSLQFIKTTELKQCDKVTEIGENVKIKGDNILADFTSIHRIGRNVTLDNLNGVVQCSNNMVFDNFKVDHNMPIFCKGAIFKNCDLRKYKIVGEVAELYNVDVDAKSWRDYVRKDALAVGCRFKYDGDTYVFEQHRLVDCRMKGNYDPNTYFDMSIFTGSIKNSFVYQRIALEAYVGTSNFEIDEVSLHGWVRDDGNYLASVQRTDGRDVSSSQAKKWSVINGLQAYDYEPISDNMLTNDGSMFARGSIATLDFGDNTPDDLLSDVTFSNSITVAMKGDIGTSNLNMVSASTSTVVIPATMLLRLLQSGGSYLNDVDFTLQVDNDLPAGFSYLLIKTNPNVLQNLSLTVNVSNDAGGDLVKRLQELYPHFTINSI